jgi:L-fuconolactonase
MIGSDWPVCLVAGSYNRTIDVVKDYLKQHNAEIREAVLGENARRFWKLKA